MPQELGKELTEWAMFQVRMGIAHSDVSAWGAPSECHDAINVGFRQEEDELDQRIPFSDLMQRVEEVTGKDPEMVFDRVVTRLMMKHNPFH